MNSEKQVFKTRIDKTFISFYLIMFLLIVAMTVIAYLLPNDSSMFYFMAGFSIVALAFMASAFFLLKIIIKDEFLYVHLFYPIYKVDIRTITTITTGKTMWVGFHKHGTATKGLIISSKFKNDLYITPKNESLFLQKLSEVNPNIHFSEA